MAVQRRVNWISQQRVDVPDMRSVESAASNDFDQLIQAMVTNTSQGYIVRGFNILMAGAIGGAASSLQLQVDPGSILHIKASQSGTVLMVPTGTPAQQLNAATNTNVSGAFSPSSVNYVTIDYTRFVDDTTAAQVYIWDPTTNSESTIVAPRAQILEYVINISTSTPSSNLLPVAVVLTDAGNNVLEVTDARWLLCRLGTGGPTPNPSFVYPWPEGRAENPSSSTNSSIDPFFGGDKALSCLKDWMNAVMSILQEIKGTTYWYSVSSSGSLQSLREDLGNTVITGAGTISHGILPNASPILTTTGNIAAQNFYTFTVSSANATAGAVYTNNSQSFTVSATIVAGTTLTAYGTGNPLNSGTLTKISGTGDATITFSAYTVVPNTEITSLASVAGLSVGDYVFGTGIQTGTTITALVSGSVIAISQPATLTLTSTTLSFYSPAVVTAPGQINWDQPIHIKVIGSTLDYVLTANASSDFITLTNDEVAYISLVRGIQITPNLIFTNGVAQVVSVGSISWTSPLVAGDFIKLASDTSAGYYQILSVDSLTQVTLTTTFAESSTGAAGAQAQYAFGSYSAVATPSSNRDIFIAPRGSVPQGQNTFWLFMREDNGGPAKVYVRFLGAEIDNGESVTVSGFTATQILQYIGSPSASTSSPQYVSALDPNSLPEVTLLTFGSESQTNQSSYFYLNSSGDARQYYVWFNENGAGTDPAPGGTTNASVQVPLTTGMTSSQVAAAVALALNSTPFRDFIAVQGSGANADQVTVTNRSAGETNPATNGDMISPFAISISQVGTGVGNNYIHDGDNLTLAIKELDQAIGAFFSLVNEPTYDETIDIVASGATPPTSLNGPIAPSTDITLPNNSRLGGAAQRYTVGSGYLQVFLNGQYLRLGQDWAEVGAPGSLSNMFQTLRTLVVGDSIEVRLQSVGGSGGGGGGEGPEGPPGPQGPPGADAVGGPVAISTKTSNYTVMLSDNVILADCTSGGFTLSLPNAATATGRVFYFKKIDATTNAMTIQAFGSQTIDGANMQSTTVQYTAFTLICDGSAYYIF